MEAIIINRQLSKKEIKNIKKQLTPYIKIYHQPNIPCYFSTSKNCEPIPENDEQKKKINYSIFDEVLNFGELKINNSAFTDLFIFGSLSLWHYSKLNVYFSVRNLFYEINFIKKTLIKYDKIYYYGNSRYLEKYFNNSNIVFFLNNKSIFDFKPIEIIKFLTVFTIRIFLSTIQKNDLPSKKHILIDNTVKQKVLNIKTLKEDYSDINFYYLNSMADSSFIVLEDLIFPTKKPNYRFPIEKWQFQKKNKIFGDFLLFKYFFKKKVRQEFSYSIKKIDSIFKSIDTLKFNKTQNAIYYFFKNDLGAAKLYLYKYIVYKHFFKKHNFKTITTIDENSARFKSILDAAKENNIKTIAIQHGTIHDLHPAYVYTDKDKLRGIQADYTLVWGKYWKEFLSNKCNYNPDSLIVTGQIRTDIIPVLLKSNIQIPQLKGINKKIVVFASQPQRDAYLRRKAAEDVFKSAKENNNIFLVVKLHQAEKNDYDYYNNIAKSVGITNYIIIYSVDLYLLLSKCDIVVTCFSSVGSETVYFNKPLIILDHLKQDIQNYHKEGIAFQATNAQELKNYIDKIISGELKINKNAYENFIEKYAYKIDGHATERGIQFIKSI